CVSKPDGCPPSPGESLAINAAQDVLVQDSSSEHIMVDYTEDFESEDAQQQ
ncbi:hypothetical protein BGX29_008081, partial [Mortierella sp. GBA35]